MPAGVHPHHYRGGNGADVVPRALAYLKGQGATCATCRMFKAPERCYEPLNGKRGVTHADSLCLWHKVKRD